MRVRYQGSLGIPANVRVMVTGPGPVFSNAQTTRSTPSVYTDGSGVLAFWVNAPGDYVATWDGKPWVGAWPGFGPAPHQVPTSALLSVTA